MTIVFIILSIAIVYRLYSMWEGKLVMVENTKQEDVIIKQKKGKGGLMSLRFRKRFTESLFSGHYIEVKAFYVDQFCKMPSLTFIGEIDASLAFSYFSEVLAGQLITVYQHSYFNYEENEMQFNNTIYVLTNSRMIELGVNYCQILHMPSQHAWANDIARQLASFRVVQREEAIGFALAG